MLGSCGSVFILILFCAIFALCTSNNVAGDVENNLSLEDWSLNDIPNPMNDFLKCNRHVRSAVCDPANLLTINEKDLIEGEINEVKGAQIGVLVINKMRRPIQPLEQASKMFAKGVHDQWGVGHKDNNDGILIFLSVKDRQFYISTGKGVMNKLDNNKIARIVGNIKGHLKANEFGYALRVAVVEINEVLNGKFDYFSLLPIGFVASLFIWAIYSEYVANKKKKSAQSTVKHLSKLAQELSEFEKTQDAFVPKCCPICLEDFTESKSECVSSPAEVKPSSQSIFGSIASKIWGNSAEIDKKKAEDEIQSLDGNSNESSRRPMVLHCGHVFCYSCLAQLLKKSNHHKCPICRKNIDKDKENEPSHSDDTTSPSSCQSETRSSLRYDEFTFRMNQMHTLYPNALDFEVLRLASMALQNHNTAMTLQHLNHGIHRAQTQLQQLEIQSRIRASGHRGSSYSGGFGGGGSGGGGGGGGGF